MKHCPVLSSTYGDFRSDFFLGTGLIVLRNSENAYKEKVELEHKSTIYLPQQRFSMITTPFHHFPPRRDSNGSSQADGAATVYHSYHSSRVSFHDIDIPLTNQSSTCAEDPESSHPTEHLKLHHRRKVRLWLLFTFAFVVLSPLASVMIGLHLHARDFFIPADVNNSFVPFNGRTLLVEAVLVSADPMSTTMVMDWIIMEEYNSPCGLQSIESCTDINIFFDK